jgi:hypothetical protein
MAFGQVQGQVPLLYGLDAVIRFSYRFDAIISYGFDAVI